MNDSLSVVVPVRNAERSLVAQVGALLDVLPDLTSRFELILVDDGSTDQTIDLACTLVRQYPQLRLVRRRELAPAPGRAVFVHEAHGWPSPADIRKFWAQRNLPPMTDEVASTTTRIDAPQAQPASPCGRSFLEHLKALTHLIPVGWSDR